MASSSILLLVEDSCIALMFLWYWCPTKQCCMSWIFLAVFSPALLREFLCENVASMSSSGAITNQPFNITAADLLGRERRKNCLNFDIDCNLVGKGTRIYTTAALHTHTHISFGFNSELACNTILLYTLSWSPSRPSFGDLLEWLYIVLSFSFQSVGKSWKTNLFCQVIYFLFFKSLMFFSLEMCCVGL